jgi:hypothetical protein
MKAEPKHVRIRTFGDAREAVAVASNIIRNASLGVMRVAHDEGCPALDGRGLAACTCSELELVLERVA